MFLPIHRAILIEVPSIGGVIFNSLVYAALPTTSGNHSLESTGSLPVYTLHPGQHARSLSACFGSVAPLACEAALYGQTAMPRRVGAGSNHHCASRYLPPRRQSAVSIFLGRTNATAVDVNCCHDLRLHEPFSKSAGRHQ